MLKNRIIPCLDVKDGRVVKGVNFVDLIDAGDPVEQAKAYDAEGADELCFLDITASSDNRGILYEMITRVAESCFMPLTVGGGVRTVEDIRNLLNAGADKVSINSAAVARPELVKEAAEKFGSQCIVVGIDAKSRSSVVSRQSSENKIAGEARSLKAEPLVGEAVSSIAKTRRSEQRETQNFEIFTHGGRNATGIDAVEWAQKMAEFGAGELLVTSMDRDGTKQGFDIPLTRAIADAVQIPIIASGGVGELSHFSDGVTKAHATGLLAASVFHFGTFSIEQVKQHMAQDGISVRLKSA